MGAQNTCFRQKYKRLCDVNSLLALTVLAYGNSDVKDVIGRWLELKKIKCANCNLWS